jgi:hypothetical protein
MPPPARRACRTSPTRWTSRSPASRPSAASPRIDFDLSDASQALTVDLDQATLGKRHGQRQDAGAGLQQVLPHHPGRALKRGRNNISVEFTRAHSTNGEGLHRYVDKADGRSTCTRTSSRRRRTRCSPPSTSPT